MDPDGVRLEGISLQQRVLCEPDSCAGRKTYRGPGAGCGDHLVGIDAMHRPLSQDPGSADCRAEQGGLVVIADAGRGEIFIEEPLELVVRRHLVALAAFLLQPHPPAFAIGKVILDAHGDDGADAREGVDHDADQRTIAQANEPGRFRFQSNLLYDLDAPEQQPGLRLGEDRRLAALHHAHRMRRVDRETWPTISQSNSMRIAARCCFTVGLAAARCLTVRSPGSDTFSALIYAATWKGSISTSPPDAVLLPTRASLALPTINRPD